MGTRGRPPDTPQTEPVRSFVGHEAYGSSLQPRPIPTFGGDHTVDLRTSVGGFDFVSAHAEAWVVR
jgi:hypothetical protein